MYQDAVYRRADSRTGHLVQIIWANTNKVGCGMVTHSREGSLIIALVQSIFFNRKYDVYKKSHFEESRETFGQKNSIPNSILVNQISILLLCINRADELLILPVLAIAE